MGRRVAGVGIFASAPAPAVSGGGGGGVVREEQWRRFDNSVDAVSFGFVATAILISMFLIMAIFERFLRGRSTADVGAGDGGGRSSGGVEPGKNNNFPSPKMSVYPNGVSVLMPGEKIPTFIAHPAPVYVHPNVNLAYNDIT